MSRGLASFSDRRAFFREGARPDISSMASRTPPGSEFPTTENPRRNVVAAWVTPARRRPSRSGVLRRIDEGVRGADSEAAEFAEVSRQEDEAVANRRRSDDEVGQSDRLAMGPFAEPSEI